MNVDRRYFIYYNEKHNEFAVMRVGNSFVFADYDYNVVVQYAEDMGLEFSLESNFKQ